MADDDWSDEELGFFAVTPVGGDGRAVASGPSVAARADMGTAAPAALDAFVAWAIERDLFLEWKAELGQKLGCTLEMARAGAPVLLVAAEPGRAIGAVVRGASDDLLVVPEEASVYVRLAPGTAALVRIGGGALLAKQSPNGEVVVQEVEVATAPTAVLAAYAARCYAADRPVIDEALALIATHAPAKWLTATGLLVRLTGASDGLPDAWPLTWVAGLPEARLLEALAAAGGMAAEFEVGIGRIAQALADEDAAPEVFADAIAPARIARAVRFRDDLESVRLSLIGAVYRRPPSGLARGLAALEARIVALDRAASAILRSLPAANRPNLPRFARGLGRHAEAWWATWRAAPEIEAGGA